MMLPRRGFMIWSCTMSSIALSPKPLLRAFRNAWSRFGPWVPLVPARWSAWQLPHVALPANRRLPFTRSACEPAVPPQPAATAARATAAPAAHAGRHFLWSSARGKARTDYPLVRRQGAPPAHSGAGSREVVEAPLGGRDDPVRHPLPAEPRAGVLRERHARPVALGGVAGEPVDELPGDVLDRARPPLEREQRPDLLV